MEKLLKINSKISFDDAKKFYLAKEKDEKEFFDVLLILLEFKESSDGDAKVKYRY